MGEINTSLEGGLALIITAGGAQSKKHNKAGEPEDLIRGGTVFACARRHLRFVWLPLDWRRK